MNEIRQKCPWDNKQTHESLKRYMVEEAYETMEAIDHNNPQELKKELGDLLLQIIFHCQIASEKDQFNFYDVTKAIADKMYERHPHVFQNDKKISAEQVQKNWEKNKHTIEKRNSILSGIPKFLPALLKAQRLQDKASSVGFDWDKSAEVISKIEEELAELKIAIENQKQDEIENEFGDLLFSLVNISRFLNITSESALQKTNEKFINRFKYIENYFGNNPEKISNSSLDELELLWQKAKETDK